jgi:ribosomal protein L11 methyltransferase
LLLIFGEHLSRNTLLPALATRVDGTSNPLSVHAFSFLQKVDENLCRALGCLNRPVSDFAAWKISSATLMPESVREAVKNSANQSLLQVEIQNRLAIAVLPPFLEVSLTDAEESEIKTLQFSPKEWLPTSWQNAHPDFSRLGAPSGEIIQADLPILLPQNAAGYRVRVFYPQ